MPEMDLSDPRRQNPVGVIVYILRNFRAIAALFVASISIGAGSPKFWLIIGIAIVPALVLIALLAYYQYRNFTFQVIEDELIIRKGVIFKDRTVIPVERIQSIKITSNLVQRIFGLVSLKVDTAGSKGNELEIPALERDFADGMKALLYERKKASTVGVSDHATSDLPGHIEPEESQKVGSKVLVHLGIVDLLKVGLTENHLKTGFLALAFVFGTWSQYQDIAERYLSGYVDEYADEVANAGMTLIITFIIAYSIISVLISMVRTVLRFFDLKATLDGAAVEISTGLLKRNQDRVPIKKIQIVEWETNPLRRLVGFESARISPSSSMGEVVNKQRIEIPALKFAQSGLLATHVFPGYTAPDPGVKADAWAYVRFNCIIGSILILPAIAVSVALLSTWALLILSAYLPIIFLSLGYGRRVSIGFREPYMLIRKGWIFPLRIVIAGYKLQSISFHQNVFLKRRKLAHLKFYTAAGSRSVRYISESEALRLYNFLLYRVENHEGDWM